MGKKAKEAHEGLRKSMELVDARVMMLVANQKTWKVGVLYGDNTTVTCVLFYS